MQNKSKRFTGIPQNVCTNRNKERSINWITSNVLHHWVSFSLYINANQRHATSTIKERKLDLLRESLSPSVLHKGSDAQPQQICLQTLPKATAKGSPNLLDLSIMEETRRLLQERKGRSACAPRLKNGSSNEVKSFILRRIKVFLLQSEQYCRRFTTNPDFLIHKWLL